MLRIVPPKPGGQYQCVSCAYRWEDLAGPTECPGCQNSYVIWLNYKEMFGKKESDMEKVI